MENNSGSRQLHLQHRSSDNEPTTEELRPPHHGGKEHRRCHLPLWIKEALEQNRSAFHLFKALAFANTLAFILGRQVLGRSCISHSFFSKSLNKTIKLLFKPTQRINSWQLSHTAMAWHGLIFAHSWRCRCHHLTFPNINIMCVFPDNDSVRANVWQ